MSLSKRDLRISIKKTLNSLEDEIWIEKESKLSFQVSKFFQSLPKLYPSLHQNFLLGAYAPMSREANWMHQLSGFEGRIAFPIMQQNDQMQFGLADYEQLEESRDFGVKILCPPSSAKIIEPAVLLIPGLGFTEKGERLGRGGGFYDKYLESFKGIKIGICLEEQLCSRLPVEAHDQRMNFIVTDKRPIDTGFEFKGE